MRWRSSAARVAVVAACLLAAPIVAAAQPLTFTPAKRFTLAGCWEGVSCHTAVITLHDVSVPAGGLPGVPGSGTLTPGDQAISYEITHRFLDGGVALESAQGFFYQYAVNATGGSLKVLYSDFDFWSSNNCLNQFLFPAGSQCVDRMPLFGGMLSGRMATPGWTPLSIPLNVFHTEDFSPTRPHYELGPYEERTVVMQLVSTEILTTPEPSTIALTATGLGALGFTVRRRRRIA